MNAHERRPALRRFGSRALGLAVRGLAQSAQGLGIERSVACGAAIGRAWSRLHGPRTRVVRDQLSQAFPECDGDWVDGCTEEIFVHLGRGLAELVLLTGSHRAALLERVVAEGLEHLERARVVSPTGGVLIVTAHLGNWELAAARVASLGVPLTVVHRGLSDPVLDATLRGLRERDGSDFEQLRMGRAGIDLVRALRRGRVVLVLLDQNARRHEGVFVPFFGRPACTRSGPLLLAGRLGVPVLAAFVHREADGRRHRIRVHPRLELEGGTSDDDAVLRRNVARVTAVIEAEIRAAPEQWIWTHRRWRTRPDEAASDRVD